MEFDLKKGKTVTIREVKIKDAEKIIEYCKQISHESANLLREPEEVRMTLEFEQEFITRVLSSNHEVMFSVWDKNHLISLAGFHGSDLNRISHRVSLGISVLKEYQAQGLGTKLMELLCEKAKMMGKTKIELDVRKDNLDAIHIYKKVGFIIEGSRKNGIKDKNKYIDLILMGKEL